MFVILDWPLCDECRKPVDSVRLVRDEVTELTKVEVVCCRCTKTAVVDDLAFNDRMIDIQPPQQHGGGRHFKAKETAIEHAELLRGYLEAGRPRGLADGDRLAKALRREEHGRDKGAVRGAERTEAVKDAAPPAVPTPVE